MCDPFKQSELVSPVRFMFRQARFQEFVLRAGGPKQLRIKGTLGPEAKGMTGGLSAHRSSTRKSRSTADKLMQQNRKRKLRSRHL
jgi:hypothetical protein